jgi:hypothetical protein
LILFSLSATFVRKKELSAKNFWEFAGFLFDGVVNDDIVIGDHRYKLKLTRIARAFTSSMPPTKLNSFRPTPQSFDAITTRSRHEKNIFAFDCILDSAFRFQQRKTENNI